ncbi:histidine kinase [Ralstonia pseudosolanacearum]|uniref:histidine kinase n=1 Tax=Ralstonia solanacearum TaxID=305 RepID=A0A0S4X1J5_RALSL|nr:MULTISPECIES: histidine kinase [Ralstonia]UZF15258.1 histidine kinase [Ralstonia solanacearum]UZF30336.1 histidine kinase [Ralstonia sp. RS650]CUV57867.1 Two-component regulatory system, sensor kinase protein [Ralstonia solanacearum]
MYGAYNVPLVSLSLVIATLASYTALDLAGLISVLENPKLRHAWLAAGAAAMGIGIWSMHFVGMLAFSLPIPLGYDFHITAASLAIAILISYFALRVVTRARLTLTRLMAGGTLMGFGIVGMHYTGMAAMRMQPGIRYDPALFIGSVVIAIVASGAALSIAHALSAAGRRHLVIKRIAAAAIMGGAITGMHYTGMAAAHFAPDAICGAANSINSQWLATTIAMFTLGILTMTLMVSRFDARATVLREMADTLEAQVRDRTRKLEGTLREYERTTDMLELTRRKMEQEIEERKQAQGRLELEKEEQRRLIHQLEEAHVQLLQSEKLASIGQLAAGVAHEINNPISFVNANLNMLKAWVRNLLQVISAYEQTAGRLDAKTCADLAAARQSADLDYVRGDILMLIDESIDGALRVRRIVQDLRDFSRPGSEEWEFADLHAGLESTLNVVHNEIKYKAKVVRAYSELPLVECIPSQLNQVFMNLLVNAAQAIPEQGVITIRTGCGNDWVSVEISDDGIGMSPEVVGRIFDPFFTTKSVGQGTGLGLSVSHSIVQRHQGRIDVVTRPGQGTTFAIALPVRRRQGEAALEVASYSA